MNSLKLKSIDMVPLLKNKYFTHILLLIIICIPLFSNLTTITIRHCDEARNAINAFEMSRNNNFLVTHYNGKPEMWNTKPPFLIWLQTVFIKLVGTNELAIRLPSALAAFFTFLLVFLFSKSLLKSKLIAFLSVLVLVSLRGFIHVHSSRTGDFDSLLTLFLSIQALSLFTFFVTKKNVYLYLFFISSGFAVMTKSVAGLLFLPGYFIYILLQKKIVLLLKNPNFYFGLLVFLLIPASYYITRENYNNGYIQAVFNNELGGRFLKINENNSGPWWFYIYNMLKRSLLWIFFIPASIWVGLKSKKPLIKTLTLYLSIIVLTFFLIISISKTKLLWYDVPMFPIISMLIAIAGKELINKKITFKTRLFSVAFSISFLISYFIVIKQTLFFQKREDYKITYFLRDLVENKQHVNDQYIVDYDIESIVSSKFYLKILRERGIKVNYVNHKKLLTGTIITTANDTVKKYIQNNYAYSKLETSNNCTTYVIKP